MEFKKNIYFFLSFILFISFFVSTKASNLKNKNTLRKLWNEDIDEGLYRKIDSDEKDSIKHCKNSDYKYFIYYVTGQNYTFDEYINYDNAVSNINIHIHINNK